MTIPARVANLKAVDRHLPIRLIALFSLILWLSGCAGRPAALTPPAIAAPPTVRPSLPPTASPSASAIPSTPTQSPTATLPVVQACSPFPGYTRADLLAAISNPFHPPPLGSDDPHQAIDLAVVQSGLALAGAPVQALLAGRVALVVSDRFPYGNALMVETLLADLPEDVLPGGTIPTPAPTLPPHPALTCPPVEPAIDPQAAGRRSLYVLYAHMQAPLDFAPGDAIACGQPLGAVGQTGNALIPHLHIEARVGPPGVRLPGLAHYETRASADEMGSYCLWRVSNLFQLVDPTRLLETLP